MKNSLENLFKEWNTVIRRGGRKVPSALGYIAKAFATIAACSTGDILIYFKKLASVV